MDRDRVKGAFRQAESNLREAAGRITDAARLKTDGSMLRRVGVHHPMGGMKDSLRDATADIRKRF